MTRPLVQFQVLREGDYRTFYALDRCGYLWTKSVLVNDEDDDVEWEQMKLPGEDRD